MLTKGISVMRVVMKLMMLIFEDDSDDEYDGDGEDADVDDYHVDECI